jgi:hypothetical protein
MSSRDWTLPARYPLCVSADSYYRTGQVIFQNLTGAITPEMVAAAQEALELYRAELESKLHPMHFGLSVGRHCCVADVHGEAIARLRCLAATAQPAPPPPAPKPQKVSDAALIANLKNWVASRSRETNVGDTQDGGQGK